jgi:hypothetical protein
VLDGERMDFSTRVPAARGAWVPVVLSYRARHSMLLPFMGPTLPAFPLPKVPGYNCGCHRGIR